ncbi:MAG: hypothetical protein AB1768_08785 [Pseudomonadota bacterium]|jgi:hypothetical protein
MIIDFILAVWAGLETRSFAIFFLVLLIGGFFWHPDRPLSSGLFRFAFIALGISALLSVFGSGDDCDCDL